jgi:HEAT repeat protein
VRILDRIGPRGVDELIAALKDKNLQWYASETLVKLDGAVLPQLQEGLRSDEEVIRNNIALILGEVKDKRAVDALLEAMKDETRVVSLAASSLVSIGDPSAVEPLIECLGHQNDQVRLYAAYALGHMKDTRAVDPLLASLRDRDPGVRGIAAYSLGVLRARKAIPRLVDLIRDPDENVRTSSLYSLGKIGDPQGKPFIQEALRRDQSPRVRTAAQEALEEIALRTSP